MIFFFIKKQFWNVDNREIFVYQQYCLFRHTLPTLGFFKWLSSFWLRSSFFFFGCMFLGYKKMIENGVLNFLKMDSISSFFYLHIGNHKNDPCSSSYLKFPSFGIYALSFSIVFKWRIGIKILVMRGNLNRVIKNNQMWEIINMKIYSIWFSMFITSSSNGSFRPFCNFPCFSFKTLFKRSSSSVKNRVIVDN